jgi:hypothetical protein
MRPTHDNSDTWLVAALEKDAAKDPNLFPSRRIFLTWNPGNRYFRRYFPFGGYLPRLTKTRVCPARVRSRPYLAEAP